MDVGKELSTEMMSISALQGQKKIQVQYQDAVLPVYGPPSKTQFRRPPLTTMASNANVDRPPPSTTSIVVATAILAVALGYFIGQGSSLGLFGSTNSPSKKKAKKPKKSWPNSYNVTIHPDSSDEEVFKQIRGADLGIESEESSKDSSEDEEALGQKQGDLNTFEGNKEECKLVLVVRTDLGMGKGTPLPTQPP